MLHATLDYRMIFYTVPPVVSSIDKKANFYIGDSSWDGPNVASHLSFSSDDEGEGSEGECRTMPRMRNEEHLGGMLLDSSSTDSSQQSVLAHPLTLNFSDEEIEIDSASGCGGRESNVQFLETSTTNDTLRYHPITS